MGRVDEDLSAVFPSDKIRCKTCVFRKRGVIGFKNGYCDVYREPPGKPNNILFDGAKCEHYTKDTRELP